MFRWRMFGAIEDSVDPSTLSLVHVCRSLDFVDPSTLGCAQAARRRPIGQSPTGSWANVTLAEVNGASKAAFVSMLGSIFEESPWVAILAWPHRPFADISALHGAMCRVVAAASPDARLALIRAHPDLVGRAARAGTLSAASTAEQASAGLDRLSPEEVVMFDELNAAYTERFDFPFVICVRENKSEAIVSGLRRRVRNDRATEVATALDEICRIARLRLAAAISE